MARSDQTKGSAAYQDLLNTLQGGANAGLAGAVAPLTGGSDGSQPIYQGPLSDTALDTIEKVREFAPVPFVLDPAGNRERNPFLTSANSPTQALSVPPVPGPQSAAGIVQERSDRRREAAAEARGTEVPAKGRMPRWKAPRLDKMTPAQRKSMEDRNWSLAERVVMERLEKQGLIDDGEKDLGELFSESFVTHQGGTGWGSAMYGDKFSKGGPEDEATGLKEAEIRGLIERQVSRNERLKSLGLNPEGEDGPVADLDMTAKPMTWDEYDALKPKQRAAVDFNTALVRAVKKDMANQDFYEKNAVSEQGRRNYDTALEDLFGTDDKNMKELVKGTDRGSDTYAPQTVALLQKIKFRDENADLDDFLSLRSAVRARDLKSDDLLDTASVIDDLEKAPGGNRVLAESGLKPDPNNRTGYLGDLAAKTESLKETLSHSDSLETFQQQLRRGLQDQGSGYGVRPMKFPLIPGFSPDGRGAAGQDPKADTGEKRFDQLYQELVNMDDKSLKESVGLINSSPMFPQMGISPNDFWNYAAKRLERDKSFQDFGSSVSTKDMSVQRNADETSSILGLRRTNKKGL